MTISAVAMTGGNNSILQTNGTVNTGGGGGGCKGSGGNGAAGGSGRWIGACGFSQRRGPMAAPWGGGESPRVS